MVASFLRGVVGEGEEGEDVDGALVGGPSELAAPPVFESPRQEQGQ